MKHLFSLFTLLTLVMGEISAQSLVVSYDAKYTSPKDGKSTDNYSYRLVADATQSKFYSPITQYLDSLQSTPDGQARYREMMRGQLKASSDGTDTGSKLSDGPYYVTKSKTANRTTYYDKNGTEQFVMAEPLGDMQWKIIADSTTTILGYECIMATTDFHGRHWTAWFAPEIPLQDGPWKLCGLPGLILQADAAGNQYGFTATGIRQTLNPDFKVYGSELYEKTDRKKFWKSHRNFMDNPLGTLTAQLGVTIPADDNDPIFAPRNVIDFIETDY